MAHDERPTYVHRKNGERQKMSTTQYSLLDKKQQKNWKMESPKEAEEEVATQVKESKELYDMRKQNEELQRQLDEALKPKSEPQENSGIAPVNNAATEDIGNSSPEKPAAPLDEKPAAPIVKTVTVK